MIVIVIIVIIIVIVIVIVGDWLLATAQNEPGASENFLDVSIRPGIFTIIAKISLVHKMMDRILPNSYRQTLSGGLPSLKKLICVAFPRHPVLQHTRVVS